jgi:aspartate carbamoyltransferase catalytic subunit
MSARVSAHPAPRAIARGDGRPPAARAVRRPRLAPSRRPTRTRFGDDRDDEIRHRAPSATPMPGACVSGLKDLKNCVEAQQFDRAMLEELFVIADAMSEVRPGSRESTMLQGYLMSTLFYEPSTRTRLSFEGAMGKLGGGILSTESAGEYSSAAKGETLEDTIRTVEGYADIVVLRHFTAGAARRVLVSHRSPYDRVGVVHAVP